MPTGLPLPILDPANSAFGRQATQLDAKCRAIVAEARGLTGNLRTIDWDRLERELNKALDQDTLPTRLRIMLPALVARLGSRTRTDPSLQLTIDRACALAIETRVWPSQAWAILTWARDDARLREHIHRSRATWPDVLREAGGVLMGLDLAGPAGQSLAQHVVASGMGIGDLGQVDYLPPGSPLYDAVWQVLLSPASHAWLSAQTEDEVGAWFDRHKGQALAARAVNTLVGPFAGRAPEQVDLTQGSRADRTIRLCTQAFRRGIDGLDLRGVTPAVQALIKRWQALRDFDRLLASWGAHPRRQQFWRSYQDKLRDTLWFERVGYLAMRFGDLWFIEHESGMRELTAVEDSHVKPFFNLLSSSTVTRQAAAALVVDARRHQPHSSSRTLNRAGEEQVRRWLADNRLR